MLGFSSEVRSSGASRPCDISGGARCRNGCSVLERTLLMTAAASDAAAWFGLSCGNMPSRYAVNMDRHCIIRGSGSSERNVPLSLLSIIIVVNAAALGMP